MTTGTATTKQQIIQTLREQDGLTREELRERTGIKEKTLASKLYELGQEGWIERHDPPPGQRGGSYHLTNQAPPEDVDADTGEVLDPPADAAARPSPRHQPGPQSGRERAAATEAIGNVAASDEEKFRAILRDAGVQRGVDSISRMFFDGDINDLEELWRILEASRGLVNVNQRKFIMGFWARYIKQAPPPNIKRLLGDDQEEESAPPRFVDESDIGWKVDLVRGRYVAKPGGELAYEKALRWAATMNASVSDDDDDEEGNAPRRGGGRRQKSEVLETLAVMKELGLVGGQQNSEVEALRAEVERMKQEQADARMERLEGMVLQLAENRQPPEDPVDAYLRLREQIHQIDPPAAALSTDSPTARIMTDAADKFSKAADRLAGLGERVMLRSFKPEEGKPGDDERAQRILEQVETRDGSQDGRRAALKRSLFGG